MFVFNRSAAAVLLPLALLLAVVLWSNADELAPAKQPPVTAAEQGRESAQAGPTLAANR